MGVIDMVKKIGLLTFIFSLFLVINVCASNANLLKNPGFEEGGDESPNGWISNAWDKNEGVTSFTWDGTQKHNGSKSVLVINNSVNDARWSQSVEVEKESNYRLSCYIKTENVGANKGANISVDGIVDTSIDIKATNNWTYVELYGKTGKDQRALTVTIGLGGYGSTNTGKAWFDDINVEKVDKIPAGIQIVNLYPGDTTNQSGSSSGQSSTTGSKSSYNLVMLIYVFLFILIIFVIYNFLIKRKLNLDLKEEKFIIFAILAAGLLLRLIVAPIIEGWPNDISANKYWANSAASSPPGSSIFHGLIHFYNSGWCDYPPVFIYVLFIIGKLASLPGLNSIFTLLIKLPSIFADLVTAYMLFRLAKKQLGIGFGILAGVIYTFMPIVLLDSTVWGQVDSFFTMIIVAALTLLMEKKFNWAVVFFTVAVLMKPQGIFFFPVILFEMLKVGSLKVFLKTFLKVFAIGLATTVLIVLPFSFTQEPLWIIYKFLDTAKEYPSAAMNAFNLFGLLGANFKDGANTLFIFSYNTWGLIFDVLILGFVGFIYIKGKHVALPIISALILNVGAFVCTTKMHERYMFPAIAIVIMALIYLKDKRLLMIFATLSITIFANIHILFSRMLVKGVENAHFSPYDPVLLFFSLVNVLLFIYLIKTTYSIIIKNEVAVLNFSGFNTGTATKLRQEKYSGTENSEVTQFDIVRPKFKLDRKDIIIMLSMTFVYLIIALINLGAVKTPQTSWKPVKSGESFVVDMGKQAMLSRLYYYDGLGEGSYKVEYLDAGGTFAEAGTIDKKNIFIWQYLNLPNIQTNQLRITVNTPGGTLNEIGVFENGSTTPLKGIKITQSSIDSKDKGTVQNLVDEQDRIDYGHSYLSGMIFDEIYHARTAYEFIHHLEPFEWTHPPLGKVFISLGILIFGMDPFGWRIIGTLFGVAMIPLMYLFGLKLFSKKFYAFCAAFLMMFDFMHFAQSRISTIDIYGTFFVILMYYFMYDYFINKSYVLGFKKSLVVLFITGVFFGLGSASKWIGLYAGGGLALLLFMTKYYEIKDYINIKRNLLKNKKIKKPLWFDKFFDLNITATLLLCGLFFVVIPGIIYALAYIPYMSVPGPGHGLDLIFRNQHDMYTYHSKGVLGATHPFSSHWWEWPLLRRPLESYAGGDLAGGQSSSMVIMGNPAIWWAGILAVLIVSILAFFKYKKKLIPALASSAAMILIIAGSGAARSLGVFALAAVILTVVTKFDKKLAVLFVAMAFQYLPWVPIERLTFIYHFFSTLPFVILTIVYVIKLIMEKYPESKLMIYTYLTLVAILFIMFYPVLSGMEVPRDYVTHWLLWFKDRWVF